MRKCQQQSDESIQRRERLSSDELSDEEKAKRDVDVFNSLKGKLEGYNCDICKNKGVVYSVKKTDFCGIKRYETVSCECSCMKVRAEINRIKKSGISKLMQRYNFESFRTENDWQKYIKEKAIEYAQNPTDWFFIGGQSGCGKTHICTAIVGSLLEQGKSARYMLWGDEITAIKQSVTNSGQYERLTNSLKNAEILYIDDFFKTRAGDSVSNADVNTTFKIINHRYNEQLPTLISSELSIKEIAGIDEALGGRISEMTRAHGIYISKDMRKNQRFYG